MGKHVPSRQTISLLNVTSDLNKLSDFFTQYVKTFQIPDETHDDLRLVIEEIFVNIASYAFQKEVTQSITVELNNSAEAVNITFIDTGIAFNPLTDTTDYSATDDHCEGGMGIHIIKSLTDKQEYNRVGQSNVFSVTKHYTK